MKEKLIAIKKKMAGRSIPRFLDRKKLGIFLPLTGPKSWLYEE
jgi:hypothetical protein